MADANVFLGGKILEECSMNLLELANDVLLDDGYRSLCGVVAEDAAMTDMEKHDAKYHPKGYHDGDACKYRDMIKKGDMADLSLDPENVDGEAIPKAASGSDDDESRMAEIFREYRHNMLRSDNWLMKNLGITGSKEKNKASSVLASFQMGKLKKGEALEKLIKCSGGLPKDAWKPGKKSGAKSSKKDDSEQLPLFSPQVSTGGAFSQYYHAQGKKSYSQEKHDATGLYKTMRDGGRKALAREEDVPGLSPFHKRRPSFNEVGSVPSSLTDEELSHFRWTANGSTFPTVGSVNGRNFIVKHGLLKDGIRRNADLNDHLKHEVAADKFIRQAGLRAPVCTTFERQSKIKDKNGNPRTDLVKIAEYVDGGVGLAHAWFQANESQKQKIRDQAVKAYPVMSFLELVDSAKNDNILVDKDWNLWFVDNGACFDYRAQGGKKLLNKDGDRMSSSKDKTAKPWYYERQDPTDEVTGYLGLAYAPDQRLLQEILSEASDRDLVEAAKQYRFADLVKTLPKEMQKPGLVDYAKKLDETVRNPPDGWIE